ncbi:MAG TPA: ATP-binding protein, partial [candidate division Zixibacteria bacterium]|nr:ATP-binding protein [candidate division Zixibacteria bacterium]
AGLAAVNANAARDTLDAGFGSLSAVTVGAIRAGVITDAAIADQAIDITEFAGAFDSTQAQDSWRRSLWRLDTAAVNAGFGALLKDTSAYQAKTYSTFDPALDSVFVRGGAVDSNRTEQGGSGDSSQIARWVWNTPSANHTGGGTFGDYLDSPVSGISGGSGAYSIQLVVLDTSIAQVVPQALVSVFNLDQSALLALRATDNAGIAEFNLDADSFTITVTDHGRIFPAFDTLIVTGPMTDTVRGYGFNPGAPGSPLLVRAYGIITDITGAPDTGAVVSVYLPGGVAQTSQTIVSPFTVSAVTDSIGFFYLDLIPSSQLIPDTLLYEFTVYRSSGAILRKRLVAPDSVSWRVTW